MRDQVGNVRVVYGDFRRSIDDVSDGYWLYYYSYADYYQYGLTMDHRQFSISDYGFGFQGMEKEEKQPESQYHTLFRQYDAVLGRWWIFDPEQESNAAFSPFLAMGATELNKITVSN